MSLLNLWGKLYTDKTVWLDRTLNKFIESLKSSELKDILKTSIKGTVTISVYGKSQVGKTTFILNLLNIKQESLKRIHTILRCGSKPGEAATPTAMIYSINFDGIFCIRYSDSKKEFTSEEDVESELKQVRKRIENESDFQIDEIVIEIPNKYFNDTNDIYIQIMDLPGINSSNEKESKHVERILKKFIPVSAYIFVFQIGSDINDLSNLFNHNILNTTYGWNVMPKRYIAIITRAFTAESVFRSFNSDEVNSGKNWIKEHYRKQANINPSNPHNLPEEVKIFPLEMCDSLNDIPHKYPNNSSLIESILTDFWEDIRKEVKSTKGSVKLLERLLEVPESIKKMITIKENEDR
ncbi:MAG: hypothetical protein IAE91_04280, partial [Ignavibacteriaceae bacterium]|nr:hypothetical protein [Ignavibacteriaceae bacterium]